MKTVCLIASAFLVSGCATAVKSTMDGVMSSWEGEPIEAVIAQWGEPHQHRQKPSGATYVWRDDRAFWLTVSDTPGISHTPGVGVPVNTSCDRVLEVDDSGTVVSWNWRGNDCPFSEAGRHRNWRNG